MELGTEAFSKILEIEIISTKMYRPQSTQLCAKKNRQMYIQIKMEKKLNQTTPCRLNFFKHKHFVCCII